MAKILIIDDERGVCEEFASILKDENHEVDTAQTATEGFEKIKFNQYDLIFLDVLMPKIEGRQALEEIKKISQTPVVIMSGFLPSHKESAVIKAGAVATLKKPFELKQVFELIDKVLKSKKP